MHGTDTLLIIYNNISSVGLDYKVAVERLPPIPPPNHLAVADLAVAVQLGEHQLFAPEDDRHATGGRPDLCCGRTQFDLKVAAAVAGHPVPDDLARLTKSIAPFKDHKPLAAVLQKGRPLTVGDVNGILDSLAWQHYAASPAVQAAFQRRTHPADTEIRDSLGLEAAGRRPAHFSCVLGENHITDIVVSRYDGPVSSICDLRTPGEMEQMLSNCLDVAATTIGKYSYMRSDLITSASSTTACECEQTRYLKMGLADTIHAFYIKEVSLLPRKALHKHLRGILVAGHCYGPMDPVFNIILNAIWYDNVYPLLEIDAEIEPDILGSQSMLRIEARSLDSLVAMVCTATGLSEHKAVEYLCYKQCDLSVMLQVAVKETCYRAYDRAGQAGKHPKHLELASFLMSMARNVLQDLRSLLTQEATGEVYATRVLFFAEVWESSFQAKRSEWTLLHV
ncbi:hypothetical protein E2562_006712 [Oryza meyeriana var. granulata]|uniref:PIR2-like helical domain-containing protein n=1 Tax=Oryza meyeriana var. granulata TaxID=110450 RepID=A0A6G1EF86_9ORYZ|nr:hypothetical protein E2562_006712 [Oryza meyeriana var. granulata]